MQKQRILTFSNRPAFNGVMGGDWHTLVYEVEDRLALTAAADPGFYEVTGAEHTAVIAIGPGRAPTVTVIEEHGDPVDVFWSRLPVYHLRLRVSERGWLISRMRNPAGGLVALDLGVVERIVEVAMWDPLHRWRR
ncbi:hypothetical protein RCH23_002109 [Cryobacterium sp. CAN_C3]|uniref:hypothetical protein n=1 Tax=unclassified Cryobacterium TaxID=2649013 RepID=UPI0018CBBD37|nr:hypothetical protein [Cryobacterium sp. CAN_C3]MEC5154724.1 hypothetical protein [Cryobacterium sp. CAN_C3]